MKKYVSSSLTAVIIAGLVCQITQVPAYGQGSAMLQLQMVAATGVGFDGEAADPDVAWINFRNGDVHVQRNGEDKPKRIKDSNADSVGFAMGSEGTIAWVNFFRNHLQVLRPGFKDQMDLGPAYPESVRVGREGTVAWVKDNFSKNLAILRPGSEQPKELKGSSPVAESIFVSPHGVVAWVRSNDNAVCAVWPGGGNEVFVVPDSQGASPEGLVATRFEIVWFDLRNEKLKMFYAGVTQPVVIGEGYPFANSIVTGLDGTIAWMDFQSETARILRPFTRELIKSESKPHVQCIQVGDDGTVVWQDRRTNNMHILRPGADKEEIISDGKGDPWSIGIGPDGTVVWQKHFWGKPVYIRPGDKEVTIIKDSRVDNRTIGIGAGDTIAWMDMKGNLHILDSSGSEKVIPKIKGQKDTLIIQK
ncbi:hypothetical protein ACFL6Y_09880 [Elusimicrobiota bacterium]